MPSTPSDRPSIAEIAAFTRRLRELSQAGRDADPAERERFLADKRALFDRIAATDRAATDRAAADTKATDVSEERHVHDVIGSREFVEDAARYTDHVGVEQDPGADDPWADYRTYTPTEAAGELIARGVPPDQAPGVVDRHVDAMRWDRGWSPQDQWQIDDDDLADMTSPDEHGAGWAAPAGTAETAQTRAGAVAAEAELEHRAQLARWDHTGATADVDDLADEHTRVIELCNPIPGEEPTP